MWAGGHAHRAQGALGMCHGWVLWPGRGVQGPGCVGEGCQCVCTGPSFESIRAVERGPLNKHHMLWWIVAF